MNAQNCANWVYDNICRLGEFRGTQQRCPERDINRFIQAEMTVRWWGLGEQKKLSSFLSSYLSRG